MIASMGTNPADRLVDTLRELGFTDLEARVYLHVLRSGPETGYAIAKAIGKAGANTYKAIESLQEKGAAEVDEGEPRLCRATPPVELIARLRRRTEARLGEAERELERIGGPDDDDGVYQMRDAAQVVERARQMLAGAERTVVIDVFPALARALAAELIAAAERGVAVVGLFYEAIELPGVEVILHADCEAVRKMMAAEHMLLCADASRALLALLDPPGVPGEGFGTSGGVRQAVYTSSPFVAWHLHDNLHHQLFTYAVREQTRGEGEVAELLRAVYMRRVAAIAPIATPGWRELLRRYGTAEGVELTDRFIEKNRAAAQKLGIAAAAHESGAAR
jgi:sugar-specific transcriptional regulator TrmB